MSESLPVLLCLESVCTLIAYRGFESHPVREEAVIPFAHTVGRTRLWVPRDWWTTFFLNSHPALATYWGPIVGPLIAIVSFVCSVGNVPLAAVLWNGGISFGGVIAFIFADLIVLPILNIYRKYYGWRMVWLILTTFYVAMAGAALLVRRFLKTDGPHMIRMMDHPMAA